MASFQGVKIEGFHCIQMCPFQGVRIEEFHYRVEKFTL